MRSIHSALLLSAPVLVAGACRAPGGGAAPVEPGARVVVLEHKPADAMAATLRTFLAQDAAASGDGPKVVVVSHPASNSLLIRGGSEERLGQVLALIARLDVPGGS